jgi:hypothetical protein
MERRSFVKASLLSGAATAIIPATGNALAAEKATGEFYELRIYSLKNDTQQKLVEDYFETAAIPALNRLGVKHTGVFTELKPNGQTKIYALIAYNSIEHFITVTGKIDGDEEYRKQGDTYLNAPATEPAYERIESSLLKAFARMPKLDAPAVKPRIFELRQYQSPSESAGKKKIDMFNEQGEMAVFKRLGFNPVFFSETIIGASRPNLTYMLTFDDMDAHNAHWKLFGSDPQWKQIKSVPGYADALLVSKITSTFIVPTAFSQI